MEDILKLIENTIEIIEQTCSANVIVYDIYGTFLKTPISQFPQYNRWHLMPYCLHIKSDPNLYSKCRILKRRLLRKTDYDSAISKTTCFCGVTEYNVPIKIDKKYIGLISVTGFRGEIKNNILEKCARRLGITPEKFKDLMQKELSSTDKEKFVLTMLQILRHLFNEFIKQNPSLTIDNPITNTHMVKALNYISLNYTKSISASDVAKECYISTSHLKYLFSKYLGHGIAEEIRKQQINFSKELLSTTQYSVKQIAYLCGFESSDYFCTVFKRETKISPLQYRKMGYNNILK